MELLDKCYSYTAFSDDFHTVLVSFPRIGCSIFNFIESKCRGNVMQSLKERKLYNNMDSAWICVFLLKVLYLN